MQWDSLDAFLAMGGHGRFVWGAYAFTVLVMAVDAITSRRRLARARAAAREGADA
ncbi:heme exporter protein CcmD [Ideonella sp. 4Y11]|uniref:Heme exporter protein D n=1 Tax=Ideonella aquatica TaxID=2824119 RepID=A0A941BEC7_9BURK|nr:heme exporter protein CcmD [Ideonella aquatica]MBQ0957581.1 heme exporter protein CcmD [Ideonella aquatica]